MFKLTDIKKMLLSDKWFAIIMVLVMYLCAALLVLLGVGKLGYNVYKFFHGNGRFDLSKTTVIAANFISIIDLYLLAIVFYIFAIGVYKLLIGPLNTYPWLNIETIDDLKDKIAKMIILFLCALFVRFVAEWQSSLDILFIGISMSLISGALIFYCYLIKPIGKKNKEE